MPKTVKSLKILVKIYTYIFDHFCLNTENNPRFQQNPLLLPVNQAKMLTTPPRSPDWTPTTPQYSPSYNPCSPCAKPDHPDFAPSPTSPTYSSFFPTSRAAEDPMLINGVRGSTPHHSPPATPEEISEEIPDFTPLTSPVYKTPTTGTLSMRTLSTAMKRVNSSMQVATPIKKAGANNAHARPKGARNPKTRPLW